jgi:hypothetical protein
MNRRGCFFGLLRIHFIDEPCDLFLGVRVVPGAVFHHVRGDYVEAPDETRPDQRSGR